MILFFRSALYSLGRLFKILKMRCELHNCKGFNQKNKIFPDILINEIAYLATTMLLNITKFCKGIDYQSVKEIRYI